VLKPPKREKKGFRPGGGKKVRITHAGEKQRWPVWGGSGNSGKKTPPERGEEIGANPKKNPLKKKKKLLLRNPIKKKELPKKNEGDKGFEREGPVSLRGNKPGGSTREEKISLGLSLSNKTKAPLKKNRLRKRNNDPNILAPKGDFPPIKAQGKVCVKSPFEGPKPWREGRTYPEKVEKR